MDQNTEVIRRLVSAFHILHKHGIVRESGSLSLRNPQNSSTYLTSDRPAILVSSRSDLSEYYIDDSNVRKMDKQPPEPSVQTQHLMHSCIYAQYPGVNCIIFSNAVNIVVFGLCNAGGSMLLPTSTSAGFISHFCPIFNTEQLCSNYPASHARNLLINDQYLGHALALALNGHKGEADGVSAVDGVSEADKDEDLPKHNVALVRGQGAICWATSLEEAVYRAIHTERNCRIQRKAMTLRENTDLSITYLDEREARDCAILATEHLVKRSWEAWLAEVERSGKYRIEVPLSDGVPS